MGNQAKPSFSLNSAGPTTNSGGSYFIRQGGSVKTTLADQEFTTRGLGGPLEGDTFQDAVPTGALSLNTLMQFSNSMLVGNGKLNYNFLQCIWQTQDTSVSGIEFGYLNFGVAGGGITVTPTYVRLLDFTTSSASPFALNYDSGTINFTPGDRESYIFGFFNNSGATINRPVFMATLSGNDNLS